MKKKIAIFSISTLLVVGFIIMGIIFLVSASQKLDPPKEIRIIELEDKIYAETDLNLKAQIYIFKIETPTETFYVDSTSYITDISSYVVDNAEYKISAKYQGSAAGSDSEFSSSVTWQKTTTLAAPVLELLETSKTLRFNSISGASYYELNLRVEGNNLAKVRLEATNEAYMTYSLSNLDGGVYSFSVFAYSSEANVKRSKLSNTIDYEYVTKYRDIVISGLQDKILTCTSENNLKQINVYIGGKKYTFEEGELLKKVEKDNGYEYKINLTLCYEENQQIGVQPEGDGIYNQTGSITYLSV